MPDEALIPANNLQRNVVTPVVRDPEASVMPLAERYFRTQVAGQAEGTVDAKQRDLACFLTFYVQLYGHDDRREWFKSVTEALVHAHTSPAPDGLLIPCPPLVSCREAAPLREEGGRRLEPFIRY
jgi:hypothetical protein